MSKFFEYVERLPVLKQEISQSPSYDLEFLTESKIKEILGADSPMGAVYVMYDKGVPTYVGRSKTIAQKIGVDERSIGENQATVATKILKEKGYSTMREAREYLYNNYKIKFIPIDDEKLRYTFLIYLAMELETKFNNFKER
ncbi:hypothetical protein [Oceanirhabdus sp. W0125-5]|uniref:hypothetical protein n=1 Tax=Oceanirhabdus sp. W0125-5 TaxID=2999116 RepID=UPI0022F34225|nr:hypothetical protein [Oceanirhabdus sp. W0125-5]WBW95189.1 hypothetical protein OW730_16010 [Oceanirhabdus sp. W0125-5]